MKRFLNCIALAIWLTGYAVSAQPHWDHFEVYNTHDRIPHDVVLSVAQDHRGYLWVGTQVGLVRYNGTYFEPVSVPDSIVGLENTIIESIYCDRSGKMWVGTRYGIIACFDPATSQWVQYLMPEMDTKGITCFGESSDNIVWFGTRAGYYGWLNPANQRAVQVGKKSVSIYGISTFREKLLLRSDQLFLPEGTLHPTFAEYDFIPFAKQNSSGAFYLIHDNVVSIWKDTAVNKVQLPASMHNAPNTHYAITAKGELLIAAAGKIVAYNELGEKMWLLPIADTPQPEALFINTLFGDCFGQIWIGSNYGLVKVNRKKYRFKKWSAYNVVRHMPHNYVRSIYEDGHGALWVGFKNGRVNRWKDGQRMVFPSDFPNGYATINCMLEHSSGLMLFGGNEGLFVLDPQREKMMQHITIPGIEAYSVWSLYEDKSGQVWAGTLNNGLMIFDAHFDLIQQFRKDDPGENTISSNSVWKFFKNSKGTLWVGTNEGVDRVTLEPDITFHPLFDSSLFDDGGTQAWQLTEDRHGRLWIGTTDHGITIYDPTTDSVSFLNPSTRYPFNTVSSMLWDDYGFLWVGTINGLCKLTEEGVLLNRFVQSDGIISNDFNFGAAARSVNGHLFVGSKAGMMQFDPALFLAPDSLLGNPVIHRLDVFNKTFKENLDDGDTIYLDHDQNFIRIYFSLLDFSNPERHQYHYRLSGFDSIQYTTDHHLTQAVYTNVPPGTYRFKLKASNDGFLHHKKSITVTFIITPALWQRTSFQLLVTLVLLSLAGAITHWRVKHYINRNNEQERFKRQLAEMELKALQTQMNPHFIFNALNAIQHYVVKNDTEKVNDYLGKFAQLMRLILESSKHQFIRLADEISLLETYVELERLRFGHRFDVKFCIDPSADMMETEIPSLFIQPFVENAINHGLIHREAQGLLMIQFEETDAEVICTIDDNGIGRKESRKRNQNKEHPSRSMEIIKEQVTHFKKEGLPIEIEIIDKEAPNTGTTVIIKIAKEYAKNTYRR